MMSTTISTDIIMPPIKETVSLDPTVRDSSHFILLCENANKTCSYGADDRAHCPRDSPMNRARGKKLTFLRDSLYCNEAAAEILNMHPGFNFQEVHTQHTIDHTKSRVRFRSVRIHTESEIYNIFKILFN